MATSSAPSSDDLSGFYVMANGQVESADFKGTDSLSCSFHFTRGDDWREVHGVAKGESQIAKFGSGANQDIVWNLPFDVTWTSTNAFGWPRMVVEVRHLDFLGREVVLGYGSMLVPTVPGRYIRYIRTFAPVSGSAVQGFLAWLTANRPEFVRPDFVTENKGREVTRVQSTGVVRVQINVLTRGMAAHGYTTGGPPDSGLAPGQRSALAVDPQAPAGAAFANVASVSRALSSQKSRRSDSSAPRRSPDEVLASFQKLRASGMLDGAGGSASAADGAPSAQPRAGSGARGGRGASVDRSGSGEGGPSSSLGGGAPRRSLRDAANTVRSRSREAAAAPRSNSLRQSRGGGEEDASAAAPSERPAAPRGAGRFASVARQVSRSGRARGSAPAPGRGGAASSGGESDDGY